MVQRREVRDLGCKKWATKANEMCRQSDWTQHRVWRRRWLFFEAILRYNQRYVQVQWSPKRGFYGLKIIFKLIYLGFNIAVVFLVASTQIDKQIEVFWRQWLALCNARILTYQKLVRNCGRLCRLHILIQQSTRRTEQQINLLRLPSKRLLLDGSAIPRWWWFFG